MIDEDCSLDNMEILILRAVMHKNSSVTLSDMLDSTLEFALKVNEFIDIQEAIEMQQHKDAESEMKQR